MAMEFRICRAEDVGEGELLAFEHENLSVPVLVTRVNGELIAGSDMCPHEDVPLSHGTLDEGTIICSAHGYAFDLKTGTCTHDKDLQWRRYGLREEDGDLYVCLV